MLEEAEFVLPEYVDTLCTFGSVPQQRSPVIGCRTERSYFSLSERRMVAPPSSAKAFDDSRDVKLVIPESAPPEPAATAAPSLPPPSESPSLEKTGISAGGVEGGDAEKYVQQQPAGAAAAAADQSPSFFSFSCSRRKRSLEVQAEMLQDDAPVRKKSKKSKKPSEASHVSWQHRRTRIGALPLMRVRDVRIRRRKRKVAPALQRPGRWPRCLHPNRRLRLLA